MDNIGQKWDGLLILVKLGCTITGLTTTHLVRFLRRYYRGLSKDALIRRVHRALDKLEAEGLVTTEVVGKYRFVRLTGEGLRLFWVAVDLIKSLTSTKPGVEVALDDYVKASKGVARGGKGVASSDNDTKGGKGGDKVRGSDREVKEHVVVVVDKATRRAMKALAEELEERSLLLNLIPNYRASEDWWIVARSIYTKPLDQVDDFDRERLGLTFEAWKEIVRSKVLLFLDEEENVVAFPYRTRFTDEKYVKELIWKYNMAWDVATLLFEDAVFITVTLPPIFPLPVAKLILSFIRHRIKARLRKACMKVGILFSEEISAIYERFSEVELEEMLKEAKEIVNKKRDERGISKNLREFMKMTKIRAVEEALKVLVVLVKARKMKTPPHILGIEPQKSLAPHMHMIIFGVRRIMDKRELTLWLDQQVTNYLSEMGRHTKNTVNNKLTEDQIKGYNKFGKKLLKKYVRYKKKHKGYRGPINWITQLKRKEVVVEVNGKKRGRVYWEFANPPPDYLKYLEERMEKRLKEGGEEGFKIDWYGGPADYVKKYLIKNLREILEEGLRNAGLIGGREDKSEERMEKSELRELWERVGEELRSGIEVAKESGSDKESEEVELKMVDDTRRGREGKSKRRKRKSKKESSWGSKVEVVKDERRRRLISSIKMGWYWLTRSPFYVVSPIFRVWSKRKKGGGGSGWRYIGSWDIEDLERFEWLERRAGRRFEIIWAG